MDRKRAAPIVTAATVIAILATVPLTGSPWSQSAAPDAVQAFVRAALMDRFRANDIPDYKVLGTSHRIGIRSSMPEAAMLLTDASLPDVDGYAFFLLSPSEAQTTADRRSETVAFITVDRPVLEGDTATVWLGVDVAAPTHPNTIRLCCCSGKAEYRRIRDGWSFVKWSTMICS